MIKNVLAMLYHGEIDPEEKVVSKDSKYHTLVNKVSEEREYFKKVMSEEDAARFDALHQLELDILNMWLEANFEYGCKFGASLMLEVMEGKKAVVS